MPILTESIKTKDFVMEYFRFGHGQKTLVILPGLSVQSVMHAADAVADAYRLLTDDFTLYVLDRRKDLPDTYPVRQMARDTEEALQALGLDRICVFGASQGGMIAMQIALDRPELVQKLVLGSTCCRVTPERYRLIGQWIGLAKGGNAQALYLAFGRALYPQDMFERARGYFADSARLVTDEDLKRFIRLAEGMQGFDMTEELGRIACPTLVIGSADDRVLGAQSSVQIAQCLGGRPDAALYMYDGYGHAVYDTAPDFPERLLRFFADRSPENPA